MKILIVSATHGEIAPLLAFLGLKSEKKQEIGKRVDETRPRLYIPYSFNGLSVDVLITGVGMALTAFWLGKTLSKSNRKGCNYYDLALNFGIAGCLDRNIEIGSVVNITEDSFADMGAEDGKEFLSLVDLGLAAPEQFSFKNNFVMDNSVLNKLPKVRGITVNTVHGTVQSINKVREIYNPSTESMEGAAFLLACLNEKIPCAQIRAVSNYVEKRNKMSWNIPLAVETLNKKAIGIINEL